MVALRYYRGRRPGKCGRIAGADNTWSSPANELDERLALGNTNVGVKSIDTVIEEIVQNTIGATMALLLGKSPRPHSEPLRSGIQLTFKQGAIPSWSLPSQKG